MVERQYLTAKIQEGAPLSSKYFNNVFDTVDLTLQNFNNDLIGPWRGEWLESETYYKNDVVRAPDQNTYIALRENQGSEPNVECINDDEGDWQLFNFSFGRWRGDWDETTFYHINDIVKAYDNNLYIALKESTNRNPPENVDDDWELFLYGAESSQNAILLQGISITQQEPEDNEALIYNKKNEKYELEKVYNQREVDKKAKYEAFLYNLVYGEQQDIKSSSIREIQVITEEEYPDDPEEDILYIVV